jgi:hypothetical protein
LGAISVALAKGYDQAKAPLYWAYFAFITDMISIASEQTSPVYGRLAYFNEILRCLSPKSVPFKTGTITYAWDPVSVSTIQIANTLDVRGYKFYMFVPGGTVNPAGWPIMDPPAIPSGPVDFLNALAYFNIILGNDSVPHLKYIEGVTLGEQYARDVSSFAAGSSYYGGTNSPASGGAYSIESEVPFQSLLMSGYTQYDVSNGRVGKKFGLVTSDTTAGLTYGLFPGFFPDLYRTCYPTSFSYLDLDEVVFFLQSWYAALTNAALANIEVNDSTGVDTIAALTHFTYSPQQFRIAVAQCIRAMFSTSQAAGQFTTYSSDPRGFEPLRMGSNCYGKNRSTMCIPTNLAENLRMLQPHIMNIKTKFYNKKNQWILSPIWGVMKNANPVNVTFSGLDANREPTYESLFAGLSSNDPNVIDGTLGGLCLDLNCELVETIISEWNLRIDALKQYAGRTSFMEGSSEGCLLFQTRYHKYSSVQEVPMTKISPFLRNTIPKECIKKVPRTVARSLSQKNFTPEVFDEIYIPSNGSLYTQYTESFSSLPAFTTAQKTMINYLIYPICTLEPTSTPTQQQIRVTDLQCQLLDIKASPDGITSRASELAQFAKLCAPGTAASETDELTDLFVHLSNEGEGGFLRDVCVALAGLIPW